MYHLTATPNPGPMYPPQRHRPRASFARDPIRLDVDALSERLSLLVHIGLPCMVFLNNHGIGRLFMGPIRRYSSENAQILIEGDQFSLDLDRQTLGDIYLTDQDLDRRRGAAVELFDLEGKLITRISGLPDPVIGAVWQDLMDSFAHSTL